MTPNVKIPGSPVMGSTALFLQEVAPGQQFVLCDKVQAKQNLEDAAGKFSMPKGPNSERDERRGWSASQRMITSKLARQFGDL